MRRDVPTRGDIEDARYALCAIDRTAVLGITTFQILSYNHSQRGCVYPLAKAAVGVDTAAVTAAVVAVVPAELAGGQSESL